MAIQKCKKVLETDPAFSVALLVQGLAYQQMGETEAAKTSFTQAVESSRGGSISKAALAGVLAKENAESSLKILQELHADEAKQFVSPYSIASIYAALGKADEVFHWLNKAIDTNSVWIIHLHFSADPRFNEYKSDARYSELLKRINLAGG